MNVSIWNDIFNQMMIPSTRKRIRSIIVEKNMIMETRNLPYFEYLYPVLWRSNMEKQFIIIIIKLELLLGLFHNYFSVLFKNWHWFLVQYFILPYSMRLLKLSITFVENILHPFLVIWLAAVLMYFYFCFEYLLFG